MPVLKRKNFSFARSDLVSYAGPIATYDKLGSKEENKPYQPITVARGKNDSLADSEVTTI